jgi:hypothetical protein
MQLRRATDVIRVVGFDPSLRNWGIAIGDLVPSTSELTIDHLEVVRAIVNSGKQVRQNSQDLDVAEQLAKAAVAAAQGAQAVFVEVPVGSQSARAMASYGICVGVLGALRAQGIPFFEVNPEEVKLATGLKKTATKDEMVAWATQAHQTAPWPSHNGKLNMSQAEHMADACAAIHAGISSKPFQQALAFITKQAL